MASKLAKTTSKSSRKKPKLLLASPPHRPVAIDKSPLGTDGFEFVEYAAPVVSVTGALSQKMGFTRDGLDLAGLPEGVEWHGYADSWKGESR